MPLRLPPLRFSLLGLMTLVAYVALGCAALRSATPLWASALFTLAVGLLMIALLGIAMRREQVRAGWIGFLVFGGGYLLLACGPWSQGNAQLVTNYALTWLELKLDHQTQEQPALAWTLSGNPSLVTAAIGSPYVDVSLSTSTAWTSSTLANRLVVLDTVNGQAVTQPSHSPFVRVGHCLLSPLIGLVGVLIASWLYAGTKQGQKQTSPIKPVPLESPFTSAEDRT